MSDTGLQRSAGDRTGPAKAYRSLDSLPTDLAAAPDLFKQAEAAGYAATIVLTPLAAAKDAARAQHDIRGALRTLNYAAKAVQTGYRFDDQMATAKLDAIAKAVALLEQECDLLLRVLTVSP